MKSHSVDSKSSLTWPLLYQGFDDSYRLEVWEVGSPYSLGKVLHSCKPRAPEQIIREWIRKLHEASHLGLSGKRQYEWLSSSPVYSGLFIQVPVHGSHQLHHGWVPRPFSLSLLASLSEMASLYTRPPSPNKNSARVLGPSSLEVILTVP